jgi:exosortase
MAFRALALPLLAAAAAGAVLYAPVLAALGRQWIDDTTTSHGILLAIAAVVVVVRRLPELRTIPLAPSGLGVLVVGFGLLLYTLGTLGAEVFVLRVSIPFVLLGVVMALWGVRHARALVWAFGLVLLAIPLPGVAVTSLTMPLQLVASQVAEGLLAAGQIPVVREGNLLFLDRATLEVAEACSGLRSATSLLSVAAVCAALFRLTPPRAFLLMAVALPVAIVGNGFRVAATGFLTHWIGERATQGLIHDMTGYVAFFAMFGVTLLVLRYTRPAQPPTAVPAGI